MEINRLKLECLIYSGKFYNLDIVHPETIKHLGWIFADEDEYRANLSSFVKLEYVICHCIDVLVFDSLIRLNHLKELRFDNSDCNCRICYLFTRNSLISIYRFSKQNLKKDLQIYYDEIRLLSVNQINEMFNEFADDSMQLDDY